MRLIDADELEKLFREVIGRIAKRPDINFNMEHMIRASAMVIEMIKDAPTVTPEPHWIPVTERLPEESNIYIVTVDKDYISPNCDSVDTLWWEAKSQEWQYENRNAFVKFPAPVLAWMPLPEGWEEKKNA